MFYRRGIWVALVLAIITTTSALAQSGKLKRAKDAMDALDYVNAIQQYQQILQSEDNAEAKINLAECYRKINDTENAEYWYSQVVRLQEVQPVHKLYYGQMLQVNGKCDLAKEWYDQFTKEVPEDVRGQYLVKACDYEDELMTKNAGIYEVAGMPFNSNLDDFSPTIFKKSIVFATDRLKSPSIPRVNMWTGNPFNELFVVDYKAKGETPGSYEYGRPDKYSKVLNTKFHEAAVAFSPDGKTIFFTRNNFLNGKTGKSDDGIIKLKVFYGDVEGDDEFKNLQSLPFNSDEYSVAHPTISADGKKMYFASDMPGGFGGMDLYVSEMEGNRWGPPVNLGPMVNTEGHEIFPFVDKNNRVYFASDGHIGLGGLDIYYTTEKALGEWNVPVNLGYPVNTNHDDFSITFHEEGTWGYFASDRDGGAGRDDIYGFKKMAAPVEVLVFDAATKEPIKDAEVVSSLTGNKMKTGADGKISFDMKLNECANFSASKETYEPNKQEGCTKNVQAGETVKVEIPLDRQMKFDIQGIVFDMTDGLPAEGVKVTITNDCGQPTVEAIMTSADGRYKFPLDKNCCYTVKAEKDGFIAVTSDGNCTKGLTQSTTLNANINLQPYKLVNEPPAEPAAPPFADIVNKKFPDAKYNPETKLWERDGKPITGKIDKDYSLKDGQLLYRGNPADEKMAAADPKKPKKEKDPKMPKYDQTSEKYVDANGKPANIKLGNGLEVKDGILYDNGVPKMPKKGEGFDVSPAGDGFLVHIYYDFDQASIREESKEELEKLMKMMADNPDFIVEISSHTDSRGSDGYNYRLSQRRADAVITWLGKQGVSKNRLYARGYGETQHVNDCINQKPCSEKEHQLNRRTEFRILGCKGGSNISISKPKENPKVDPCQGCPF